MTDDWYEPRIEELQRRVEELERWNRLPEYAFGDPPPAIGARCESLHETGERCYLRADHTGNHTDGADWTWWDAPPAQAASGKRSVVDIKATGAAWVTESELEELCDRLAAAEARVETLEADPYNAEHRLARLEAIVDKTTPPPAQAEERLMTGPRLDVNHGGDTPHVYVPDCEDDPKCHPFTPAPVCITCGDTTPHLPHTPPPAQAEERCGACGYLISNEVVNALRCPVRLDGSHTPAPAKAWGGEIRGGANTPAPPPDRWPAGNVFKEWPEGMMPPQAASGKRWTLHVYEHGTGHVMDDDYCNPKTLCLGARAVEVVPAADLDDEQTKHNGTILSLRDAERALKEAEADNTYLVQCLQGVSHWTNCDSLGPCERCRREAAEAREKGLREKHNPASYDHADGRGLPDCALCTENDNNAATLQRERDAALAREEALKSTQTELLKEMEEIEAREKGLREAVDEIVFCARMPAFYRERLSRAVAAYDAALAPAKGEGR